MKIKQILFTFTLIAFFASCDSNKLTREKAAEMINEFYEYPNLNYTKQGSEFYCWDLNDFNKKAINQNLLNRRRQFNSNENCWFDYLTPTESGRKCFIEKVESNAERVNFENVYILSDVNMNEVTGIKIPENGTTAEVIYSINHSNVTPFGKIENLKENSTENITVKFELFDDGWRITDEKKKVYKKND